MSPFGTPNIAKLRKKGDVPGLIRALRDATDVSVQKNAVEALGEVGDPQAIEPLIAACDGVTNGDLLLTMAATLGTFGARAVEPLLAVLENREAWVLRGCAAIALGKAGDARAVEPLIAVLENTKEEMGARGRAAEALGQLADARAVESLIAALDEDADDELWRIASASASSLGKIGDPRAVEALIAALGGSHENVRANSAGALGLIADARAIPRLIDALEDADGDVRDNAAWALVQIGAPAVDPLVAALNDENRSIRAGSVETLAKLGDTPVSMAAREFARGGPLKASGGPPSSASGTVEFDADGKVAKVDMPGDTWDLKQSGQTRYYTQRGRSLLQATEILMTVASVPGFTYYTVETPDGALGRDMSGFYTEAPIKTSGLELETPAPLPDRVESVSLTAFGDPMKSQSAVAQLRQAGQYASFVLLMECGHCGYKSPVETQAGDMERQCYCCGATNSSFRGTIDVITGSKMIEV